MYSKPFSSSTPTALFHSGEYSSYEIFFNLSSVEIFTMRRGLNSRLSRLSPPELTCNTLPFRFLERNSYRLESSPLGSDFFRRANFEFHFRYRVFAKELSN